MDRYSYGLIGLGTMGRNLLYNIAEHGFSMIGYYRKDETLDSYEDLVSRLELPRKVILMVPAGKTVDEVVQSIMPFLSPAISLFMVVTRISKIRIVGFLVDQILDKAGANNA